MRLSDLYKRAEGPIAAQFAAQLANTAKDIDIHEYLSHRWRSWETEQRERLMKLAYSKDDVSVPTMPNFSLSYGGQEFIADMVSPLVDGDITRKYPKHSKRDARRAFDLKIGSDGFIPESNISVTFPTYSEQAYGQKQKVDMNAVAQSASALDLMESHSSAIMDAILLAREIRVATQFMTYTNYASNCSTQLTSTNRWDVGPSTSTADPVKDIKVTAMNALALGVVPNALIASTPVLTYLCTHPKVIAAAGTSALDRVVPYEQLAKIFGLQYVLEGKAKYDSAGNAASATDAWVWGKGCSLVRVSPGARRNDKAFAKTFRHTPLSFRDEFEGKTGVRGVTWLIGTHEDAEVVTMDDAGFLLRDCIS